MNFAMTAEDPVAHSQTEAVLPIIGQSATFLMSRYPTSALMSILKALMFLISLLLGMVIGRQVIHRWLRKRMQMFSEDKGTWMIMFLTSLLITSAGSQLYNVIAASNGFDDDAYQVSANLAST
jgi:hypothetical protein